MEKSSLDNSALRVLVRDVEDITSVERMKNKLDLIVIATDEDIDKMIQNAKLLENWNETNYLGPETDTSYNQEFDQIRGQLTKREKTPFYFKIKGLSAVGPNWGEDLWLAVFTKTTSYSLKFKISIGSVLQNSQFVLRDDKTYFCYNEVIHLLEINSTSVYRERRALRNAHNLSAQDRDELEKKSLTLTINSNSKTTPFKMKFDTGQSNNLLSNYRDPIAKLSTNAKLLVLLACDNSTTGTKSGGLFLEDIIKLANKKVLEGDADNLNLVGNGAYLKKNLSDITAEIQTFLSYFIDPKEIFPKFIKNTAYISEVTNPQRMEYYPIKSLIGSSHRTEDQKLIDYLNNLQFLKGYAPGTYQYTDIEFFIPYFASNIKEVLPSTILNLKIFFALDTKFIVDLFCAERFENSSNRQFYQAQAIEYLIFYIEQMCITKSEHSESIDALALFLCRCLKSFSNSQGRVLGSAGARKAIRFLVKVMSLPNVKNKLQAVLMNNAPLLMLYLESVAQGLCDVSNLPYEQMMTWPGELQIFPGDGKNVQEDLSIRFYRSFILDFFADANDQASVSKLHDAFYNCLFKSAINDKINAEFAVFCLNLKSKGKFQIDKSSLFNSIWPQIMKNSEYSREMLFLLYKILTIPNYLEHSKLSEFLTHFSIYTDNLPAKDPAESLYRFLKANNFNPLDDAIIQSLAESQLPEVKASLANNDVQYYHWNLYRSIAKMSTDPDNTLRFVYLHERTMISQEKKDLLSFVNTQIKSPQTVPVIFDIKTQEMNFLVDNLSIMDQLLNQNPNKFLAIYDWYDKMTQHLKELKKEILMKNLNTIKQDSIYQLGFELLVNKAKNWSPHIILLDYEHFADRLKEAVAQKGGGKVISFADYTVAYETLKNNMKIEFEKFKDPALITQTSFETFFKPINDPKDRSYKLSIKYSDCELFYFKILFNLGINKDDIEKIIYNMKVLYTSRKLVKLSETGSIEDLKDIAVRKDEAQADRRSPTYHSVLLSDAMKATGGDVKKLMRLLHKHISKPEDLKVLKDATKLDEDRLKGLFSVLRENGNYMERFIVLLGISSNPDAISDEYGNQIMKLCAELGGIKGENITAKKVIEADTSFIAHPKEDSFDSLPAYRMPMIIKDISNCGETILFINQKADDFIKAMKDEVDNQHMDTVNQLDTINKSLNTIISDKSLKNIINNISNIDLHIVRQLEEYLTKVESQMIPIIRPLATKTIGGDAYVKKVMRSMLANSTYEIWFDTKQRIFTLMAMYEEEREDKKEATFDGQLKELKPFELEEFVNRSKIIASNTKEEDLNQADVVNFSKLGVQLETLLAHFQQLRVTGLMQDNFYYLIDWMNNASAKESNPFSALNGDEKRLTFKVNGKRLKKDDIDYVESNFEFLTNVNTSIGELADKSNSAILKYYDVKCYLLTLFTGKKFFHLCEYLRSKQKKKTSVVFTNSMKNQVEAVVKELFEGKNIGFTANHEIPDDLSGLVDAVYLNVVDWTKALYKDSDADGAESIKTTNSSKISTALPSKKIKVCARTVAAEEATGFEEMNDYTSMMKVIAIDGTRPIPKLSQILLCTSSTNKQDIFCFCSRALLDPFQRFYFILNASVGDNALSSQLLADLKDYIAKLAKDYKSSLNFNMLIFTSKEDQFKEEIFESATGQIQSFYVKGKADNKPSDIKKDKNHGVLMEKVREKFKPVLQKINVVTSSQAGMGKTTLIEKKWKDNADLGRSLHLLFFSGEMSKESTKSRILNLTSECEKSMEKTSKIFGLVIKLDTIEDFESKKELIDYLLFTLCIVQTIPTETGVLNVSDAVQNIFIEISNVYLQNIDEKLQFLKMLKSVDDNTDYYKSKEQSIYIMTENFKLDNVDYNNDSLSEVQVVARFLSELHFKVAPGLKTILRDDFIKLLKKYYLKNPWPMDNPRARPPTSIETIENKEEADSTFAQYQFWLRTVAELANAMETVTQFQPSFSDTSGSKENLRSDVMNEILHFCSQITNVSVKKAKESQKLTIDALAFLEKNINMDPKEMEKQKALVAKQIEEAGGWNSDNLIVPLLFGDIPIFSHKCLYQVFIAEDKAETVKTGGNKRKALRKFIEQSNPYVDTTQLKSKDDKNARSKELSLKYTIILARYLGDQDGGNKLNARIKNFQESKGYIITDENYMKMSLMVLKAQLRIPIVIMGESGCGKTYMTRFVSTCLLEDEMLELTLYSGVTEQHFVSTMKAAITRANEMKAEAEEESKTPKRLWMFFDEFNTSSLQSVVAEIMIDRVCSIDESVKIIPDNMVFVGCCNPYRLKTKNTDIGLVPSSSKTILSHRVFPIPERILNYVWDFGQLDEDDEMTHVQNMVDEQKLFDECKDESLKQKRTKQFIDLVYNSHKTVRDIEERSGVSLRDISRVMTLYKWFNKTIDELAAIYPKWDDNPVKIEALDQSFPFKKDEAWMKAAGCAVFITYGLRLNGRTKDQKKLMVRMKDAYTKVVKTDDAKNINDTLELLARMYLFKISQKTKAIPPNIAINRPLMENFITMLACYDTCTPMIICGAPGTSKTLCSQIFDSAMISTVISTVPEFKNFKPIYSLYYGGSETSTAEGITRVYDRAKFYLERKGATDKPVVVFDEIGLAELSPHNPLKVLHPLLEDPKSKIAFFGISNWTLDLSKMNRLVYLARPDMSLNDLQQIFMISINDCDNVHKEKLKAYLEILAVSYLWFRNWQKISGSHPNFHGSRDIYAVARFIYNNVHLIKKPEHTVELIKNAVERNFNGTTYILNDDNYNEFSDDSKELRESKSLVKGLKSDGKALGTLKTMRLDDIGSAYRYDPTKSRGDPVPRDIFTSSQIFKQIFINQIRSGKSKGDARSELLEVFNESNISKFMTEVPSMDLIEENLRDAGSRFLLVKSEGEVVDNMFMEKLYSVLHERKSRGEIRDWRGIKGKENSIELLTTLKSYISLGYLVVMKNLDELYGSLYDLFNQKYSQIEDKKFCYLYFGQNKHRVEVHDNFKAVVIINAETDGKVDADGKNIEIAQPAPFLNRFEKFFVSLANLQPHENDVKFMYQLVTYLQDVIRNRPYRFVCMSVDMIASIQNRCRQMSLNQREFQIEVKKKLFRLATTNLLLRECVPAEDLEMFKQEHPFESLRSAIEDMNKPRNDRCFRCVFTFSNPIELKREDTLSIIGRDQCEYFIDTDLTTQGLEKRSMDLKNLEKEFLVVQFTSTSSLDLVTQLKSSIKENTRIKKCLFVLHLQQRGDNDLNELSKNKGLNYWDNWENYVIENIHQTNYINLANMYDSTVKEALFMPSSLENKTSLAVLRNCVERTLVKFVTDTNDQTLIKCLNPIKRMLKDDPKNVYIERLIQTVKEFDTVNGRVRKLLNEQINLSKDPSGYIDLEITMVDMLFGTQRQVTDIIKRHLQLTNNALTNLASYAVYYNYENDDQLRDKFRTEFQTKTIHFTLAEMRYAEHSYSYYRVPFLKSQYDSFFDGLQSKMNLDATRESMRDLPSLYEQFKLLSKSKSEDAARQNIVSIEAGIRSETEDMITKLYDNGTANNMKLLEEVLADVAVAVFRKLRVKVNRDGTGLIVMMNEDDFMDLLERKKAFFKRLCDSIVRVSAVKDPKEYFIKSVIYYVILARSFQPVIENIFGLVDIIETEDEKLFAQITSDGTFNKDLKQDSGFSFNYSALLNIQEPLQREAVPKFNEISNETEFIKARATFTSLLSKSSKQNHSIKFIVILMNLLGCLNDKLRQRMINDMKAKQSDLRSVDAKMAHHTAIKNYWIRLVFEKLPTEFDNFEVEGLATILPEYFVACAETHDFEEFLSTDKSSNINNLIKLVYEKTKKEATQSDLNIKYERLGYSKVNQLERIAASLSQFVSGNLFNSIEPLSNFESLAKWLEKIKNEKDKTTLGLIEQRLIRKLNPNEELHEMFLVSLSDKLYYQWKIASEGATIDWKNLLQKLNDKSLYQDSSKSLKGIFVTTAIRLTVESMFSKSNSDVFTNSDLNTYLHLNLENPQTMYTELHRLPTVYFLQEYIKRSGFSSSEKNSLDLISQVKRQMIDADNSNLIISFDGGVNNDLQALTFILTEDKIKPADVISKLKSSSIAAKVDSLAYVFGAALINAVEKKNPAEKMDDIREAVKLTLAELKKQDWKSNFRFEAYCQLLENILSKKKLTSLYCPSEKNEEIERREETDESLEENEAAQKSMRIVLYHFALMVVCFRQKSSGEETKTEIGYDLGFVNKWAQASDGLLTQSSLKVQLVNSTKLDNMSSIYQTVIVERLVDGSYQDYGANLPKNLGIYKCSCDYVYSIGQCGYATTVAKCPVCRLEIGGFGHELGQREGHIAIENLDQMRQIILDVYKKEKESKNTEDKTTTKSLIEGRLYPLHIPITKQTPELIPLKLEEMKEVKEMRSYLTKEHTEDMKYEVFDSKVFLRHLWDHMLILMGTEMLPPTDADKYNKAIEKMRDRQLKLLESQGNDLVPRSLKEPKNAKQYISNHVKSDMESLVSLLGATQLLDYIRALHSKISDEFMGVGAKLYSGEEFQIAPAYLKSSKDLIIEQQNVIDSLRNKGPQVNIEEFKLFKNILYHKDISKEIVPSAYVDLYKLLRHNDVSSDAVMSKFKEALPNAKGFSFLKKVAKYEPLLLEYHTIVEANVRLVNYMNMNYERAFDKNIADSKSIEDLIQGKLSKDSPKDELLKVYFDNFKRIWKEKIMRFNVEFPEVFSFSFDCHKDLEVEGFIEGVLEGTNTEIRKFLLLKDDGKSLMRAIIQSLIKNFHNKRVAEMSEILLGTSDESTLDSEKLENCLNKDFVSLIREMRTDGSQDNQSEQSNIISLKDLIMQSNWFGTNAKGENEISFDFAKIQYELAKMMFKPYIKMEADDLPYFEFQGDDQKAVENKIEKFIGSIKQVELEDSKEQAILDMQDKKLEDSYDFILEMGNYAASNYLVNKIDKTLSEIINSVTDKSFTRFSNFRADFHGNFKLNQIGHLYFAHRKGILYKNLSSYPDVFSKRLTNSQTKELQAFFQSHKDKMSCNAVLHPLIQFTYDQLMFFRKFIEDFKLKGGEYDDEKSMESEAIMFALEYSSIKESKFEEISDILSGIKVKNGKSLKKSEVELFSQLHVSAFSDIRNRFVTAISDMGSG